MRVLAVMVLTVTPTVSISDSIKARWTWANLWKLGQLDDAMTSPSNRTGSTAT